MNLPRRAVLLSLLALGACAPQGPPFASVAGTLRPVPQGMARIFVYRWLEPYETLSPTAVSLNGRPVGVSDIGSVFYRDVAPGRYTISVQSDEVYPDQFKTVTLEPGEVIYVRIESLLTWSSCGGGGSDRGGGSPSGCRNTFVVVIVDPTVAQYEMRGLRFTQG
ncbi:MAG TPA: DUF2846 domain-containing protein [Stellaceae bacterium]|nr:DUF2846 domain-containing protein [Stellaceae bacterium]